MREKRFHGYGLDHDFHDGFNIAMRSELGQTVANVIRVPRVNDPKTTRPICST